jgi:hypothetical protein
MRSKHLAAAFPIGILALMAAERVVTFLVGQFPSVPAFWALSMELRWLFRFTTGPLADLGLHSISLQIAIVGLLGMSMVLIMRARSWASGAFMVNHMTLLLIGASVLLGTGSTIASAAGSPLEQGQWLLLRSFELSAFEYCLLVVGLAGCASCHYLFLSQRSERDRAVALALMELAIEPGRKPGRPTKTHSLE